jgi:ADP-dependent NAD(P)H-hydrate dehydratase / NAD(P)H-hydrate epimerase
MKRRVGRSISPAQAGAIDRISVECYGMPVLLMMENAGAAVAREAALLAGARKAMIVVVCGKGNNGGDGLVAARHLHALGYKVDVILAVRHLQLRGAARVNLSIAQKLSIPVREASADAPGMCARRIARGAVIVDALLGIGLRGEVRGVYASLIDAINDAPGRVVAVDIPSGLDAATGHARGCCVRADTTVTCIAPKTGMVKGIGPRVCGRIVVAGLGISAASCSKGKGRCR